EEQEKKAAEEARLKEEQEKAAVKADSPKDEEEWAKEDEEYAKKKAKEEQEKEEARREKMRRDRAEEERMNPVDDKILAKLNVEQVASLLCNDLEYLADAMDGSFGKGAEIYVLYDPLDRMREVESSEDLKAAIEAMEQTINSEMLQSEGKTIAKFAKDENLLGANHEKVLKRAKELAGMDLQTEQKIEEQKIEEQKIEEQPKEEPKIEEVPKEEPKVEEQPKEEPKVEEAPKEEAKVEEAPKEEAKVEEAPKVEEKPEEVKVEEVPKEVKVEEVPKEVKVEEVPKPAEKIEEKPEQVEDQREVIEWEKRSAAKWIEAFKREFRDDPQLVREQEGYPAAHIARIMAARQLSNSTRGKAATLNVQMTQADIEKQARLIMGKDSFKKFAEELKQPDKLRKVEAVFTKRFSHGGELDDSFRSYLTNRPAGKLENDPDLKRWMPTIKQRVEKLQKDAAKAIKQQETPYVAAAEIVALRQMAEVQRGGRGLEANIPVVGEKDGNVKDLSKASRKFAKSQLFKDAFNKQEVKKFILSGHGGAMVENYKKAVKDGAPVKAEVKLNK
ncbi:MAG: hypothetical protein IJ649_02395, partial [Oscillospiraceae bacterium]|nr:hypothetical protein [Oscillospiraceae bacterium]